MASWCDICPDANNNVVAPLLASKKSVHFDLNVHCREYECRSGSEEDQNKAFDAKPNRFAWIRKFCQKGKKNLKNKDQEVKVTLNGDMTIVHKSCPNQPRKSHTLPRSWKSLITKFAKREEEAVIRPTWDQWKKDLSDKKRVEDFLFLYPEEEINALKIEFGMVTKNDDEDNEVQQEDKQTTKELLEPTVQDLLDRHFLNNFLYARWYAEARKPLTMEAALYGPGGILNKPITPVYIEPPQDLADEVNTTPATAATIAEKSVEGEEAKPNIAVATFSRIRSFFARFRKN